MSELRDGYRLTGLVIVALALFLIAFDLAFFALCDSGLQVCFSPSTNRVSDLALVLFLGLFFVGIGVLAWPIEEEEAVPTTADLASTVPPGAVGPTAAGRRRSPDAARDPPT